MNNLKNTLDSLQVRTFADPIHYGGSYFENRIPVIKESDNKILKQYATIARTRHLNDDIPEEYEDVDEFLADMMPTTLEDIKIKRDEIQALDNLQYNKMFIYADAHFEQIVPDDIFLEDEKLYNYLKREEYVLVGAEVDAEGKYIKFKGTEADRLDIFGNVLDKANFRYFSHNREYINGSLVFLRCITINNEEEGIHENLLFFQTKDRGNILSDTDDWGCNRYMYDDELLDTIQFVKDLDANVEIVKLIQRFINELGESGVFEVYEGHAFQKVGYENPINLKINSNND
jgi:hypothetical protein